MRFRQNVLRMTWKERFVQFSWKAHCFSVLKRIWDKSSDFEKFDPEKYDLGKTSCAWPETSVLYNFHEKRTVSSVWREFEASGTILATMTLKNAIWPKRAAHDLKSAFCTIFMESALFSRFDELFRPVWRFWQLWRSKMRFGQNASKLSKSSHWPGTLSKTGKQCAFHKNCTKRAFQVMRSTFWPKRIFKRQSCQNRHTGLKFSPKRENSALFMKIVQNALFRSCAARFAQIAFVSVKVVKIVTLAWKARQNGKRVRFLWKLYKTLVSGHAQHVLAKSHFRASKLSKSSHRPQILSKTGKQCAFHANCTKRSFQVMRSTFWRNRILKRQSCQNRHTGLKFSPKRGNSALFMKIVQNARFRSCAARFGQIAFWSVKVVKIVTLAWKARQNGKTVRFP